MAYEDLKRELQAIDTDNFGSAVARVFVKQNKMSEARDMLNSFSDEYPNLIRSTPVVGIHGDHAGLSEREKLIATTSFLVGLMSLKEMIDTAALNEIPTAEA